MEEDGSTLAGSLGLKEVVDEADGGVCSFANGVGFINESLNPNGFTANSKKLALAGCEKIG